MSRPVDWTADERKLEPAFTDIQGGRLKPAQATVDRWLKKHPKSQPALVLRMILLERQRQGKAAVLQAYEDVQHTGPLSGRAIWRVAVALRGIRRHDLVLKLFQDVWDAHPSIPALGDQVFQEAAAIGDTAIMASASRKMFNAEKRPERARLAAYSAWASAAPSPSDKDPFPLAPEKSLMVAQVLLRTSGSDVPTADALWLRLQVALGANDLVEAWRLVREQGRKGALARRWHGMEAAKVIAARDGAVSAKEVWDDEFEATSTLLRTDPEAQHNYAFYKHILACVVGGVPAQEAHELFAELRETVGAKDRAPLLATLELDAAERTSGESMATAEWEKALRDYLERWGSKWTTIAELQGLVANADPQRAERVRAIVEEMAKKAHSDERTFLAQCVAELYLRKAKQHIPSREEAKRLWKLYIEGLVYGKNLPKTDPQPADPIGLAAVDELARLWLQTPSNDTPLLDAVACLERMVDNSPSSYPARYTLVRLYRLLGAPAAAVPHMEKMSLREIQLDSLLHVLSERGSLELNLSDEGAAWDDCAGKAALMYARSGSELPEIIKQALNMESYSKVHGIRTLRKCLDRSVAARVIELEVLREGGEGGEGEMPEEAERLAAALQDQDAWVDNRTKELLVDSLASAENQPTFDERSIRALGAVALRVAHFVRGERAPDLPLNSEELNAVDKAFVTAADAFLRRANGEAVSLDGLFDDLVKLCSSEPTTWTRLNALLSLAQLVRDTDAVIKRVTTSTKPAKGKKRNATNTALLADLRAARESITEHAEKVLAAALPKTAKWDSVADLLDDRSFVTHLGQSIDTAREKLANGLRTLL